MNQKFRAAITPKDDLCYVKLTGIIDEDNGLAGLTDQIPTGTVVIDTGEIERINSCGVRDWVNWLTKLEKNGSNVVLVECSPAIVAQINLVHNFTGQGAVKSFYAPFFCPACDLEKVLLIDAAEMAGQSPPKAPTCRCDECDGVMDFDDMEESYFAFVNAGRKIAQNAKIDAAINEISPGETKGERKVRSRVGITAVTSSAPPSSAPSLPSVPSLPSIGRISTGAGAQSAFAAISTGGGSRPGHSSTGAGSNPGADAMRTEPQITTTAASGSKSKVAILAIVGLLVVAIGLLAYVLLSGPSKPKVKVHEMPQTAIETTVRPG
jgi:anti-anti-sigma regulatory factor